MQEFGTGNAARPPTTPTTTTTTTTTTTPPPPPPHRGWGYLGWGLARPFGTQEHLPPSCTHQVPTPLRPHPLHPSHTPHPSIPTRLHLPTSFSSSPLHLFTPSLLHLYTSSPRHLVTSSPLHLLDQMTDAMMRSVSASCSKEETKASQRLANLMNATQSKIKVVKANLEKMKATTVSAATTTTTTPLIYIYICIYSDHHHHCHRHHCTHDQHLHQRPRHHSHFLSCLDSRSLPVRRSFRCRSNGYVRICTSHSSVNS